MRLESRGDYDALANTLRMIIAAKIPIPYCTNTNKLAYFEMKMPTDLQKFIKYLTKSNL